MSAPSRGQVSRRVALRLGAAAGAGSGAVAVAAAGPSRAASVPAALRRPAAAAVAAVPGVLDLYVNEGYLPMVDGTLVYHRGFGDRPTATSATRSRAWPSPRGCSPLTGRLVVSRTLPPRCGSAAQGPAGADGTGPQPPGEYLIRRERWASYLPRPTIIAETGSTIRLRVHNRLTEPHALPARRCRADQAEDRDGPIPPGDHRPRVRTAPAPGTYVYSDPDERRRRAGARPVRGAARGPRRARGGSKPGGPSSSGSGCGCARRRPGLGEIAATGGTVDPAATPAVPRYFLLNDHSGFQSLGVSRDRARNHDRRTRRR